MKTQPNGSRWPHLRYTERVRARLMAPPEPIDPLPFHVGVVGLGYVGTVTAACLAKLGHIVYGFEQDPAKLANVAGGDFAVLQRARP